LALRFDGDGEGDGGGEAGEGRWSGEGDEEAYWEDVRSVMGLLTSTLVDAAMRLTGALEDVEDIRRGGGIVSDEEGNVSPSPGDRKRLESDGDRERNRRVRSMTQMVSFAPMPSHLARFAVHVDAISSAMNGARDNLEQCVRSLREDEDEPASVSARRSGSGSGLAQDDPALLAYERLRRELGLALRECERGRERLLDLIAASNPSPEPEGEDDDDDEAADLPGLGHDLGSDESDKHDSSSPILDFDRGVNMGITVVSGEGEEEGLSADDATAHLLRMASSHHLPPQGIEQVFEAEPEAPSTAVGAFTRAKSKLTREERIAQAKARRDSGLGMSSDEGTMKTAAMETWGPGGDVVQELKDVIWQVGERRRKMTMMMEAGENSS
jgi:hypothetical protein